jgi:hypothetical protein
LRPYSPGGALTALAPAPTGCIPPTPSAHRLRRGLPGYLILFAPHAFASQRQNWSSWPPSPRVFSPISTHFTATQGIPPAPPSLKSHSFRRSTQLSRVVSQRTHETAYTPFTPNDSEQRLPLPYYRGCWHGISRGFLWGYRHDLSPSQKFTTRRPSSFTRRYCVRLSPIAQNSPLLPPVGVWPVSQCQCG